VASKLQTAALYTLLAEPDLCALGSANNQNISIHQPFPRIWVVKRPQIQFPQKHFSTNLYVFQDQERLYKKDIIRLQLSPTINSCSGH